MNWNRSIVTTSVALTLAAAPVALAQRGSRGASGSHVGAGFHTAGLGSGRAANFRSGRGHEHWGNHHWYHRRGFYPYYAYDSFGYYPFGYYPYGYGNASFYFGNNNDRYARRSGSVVVDVQQQLASAGYYRGAVDGVFGNETRRAIRAYERANRLPVNGRITATLLDTMGLG
ncbi:MAG: peptidoglycan-binding domain-containing protein [Chthoniobacterales bacterium]